jgi:hypothetical protein
MLVEKEPRLASMWRWLVSAEPEELLRLPLKFERVSQLDVRDEAKTLIGFWVNSGVTAPRDTPSRWMREHTTERWSFWGEKIRARVAESASCIKHWKIIEGDYTQAPDIEATWFVDPPYQKAGRAYPCGSSGIDFRFLGDWCSSRKGQVMVCENEGADWLPFRPFSSFKSMSSSRGKGFSEEVLWSK